MRPRGKFGCCVLVAVLCGFVALPSRADEIRLKDGKKLYGVIVAYEDNMFKVKTDYGYVLVEKDKIASIIPTAPASPKPEAAKKEPEPAKSPAAKSPEAEAKPAAERSSVPSKAAQPAPEKTTAEKKETYPNKPAGGSAPAENASAHNAAPGASAPLSPTAPPVVPAEPELPPNREEVQRNTYTNFTHHFRMYKAPSWDLIEGARRALPDAVVAMGTFDQSTLMVIGEDKSTAALDAASTAVENRLRDAYENYRRVSREKITVAGQPAIEIKYRGTADEHLWCGTLVVVPHGSSTLTILGMTYADSDLIQIQENVITRAISSLDFNVP